MTNPKKPWPDWDGLEVNCPWWGYIVLGVLSLPFARLMYNYLTDAETQGRIIEMHVVMIWIYQLLGKWGVVGCFCFISFLGIGVGIWLGLRMWWKSAGVE